MNDSFIIKVCMQNSIHENNFSKMEIKMEKYY